MATCDSLQPVVLLTDVMDSNVCETETVLVSGSQANGSSDWFQVEQTEPLNLCLNGSILDELTMVDYYSGFKERGKERDDDVIFVKEYRTGKEKAARNGKKMGSKGAPRRNPVRKARVTKRFEEYTDESFEDEEGDSEDDDAVEACENFSTKNEDSEDWKVEDMLKKNRQRRRIISKKVSTKFSRMGRKRKLNKPKIEEKKVQLKELEPLIESNLLLIKEYIDDVKTMNENTRDDVQENQKSERTKNTVNILKQQVILLAVTRNLIDGDVSKYLKEHIIP